MNSNEGFIYSQISKIFCNEKKILDYGCGKATLVNEMINIGENAYGVDLFYGAVDGTSIVKNQSLINKQVFKIDDNLNIPFPSSFFKIIYSNQVFEHVDDLDITLKELSRVIDKDGYIFLLFPDNSIFLEGHLGIPLVHKLPVESKVRFIYTYICRKIGLGYGNKNLSALEWTRYMLSWFDKYTRYRNRKEIILLYRKYGFIYEDISELYFDYRIENYKFKIFKYFKKITPKTFKRVFVKLFIGQVTLLRKY